MSDLDDCRESLGELARQRDDLAREAATLAAVAGHDALLAAALAQLPRPQRLDLLSGIVDEEADLLLRAICGEGWQERLREAVPPCAPVEIDGDGLDLTCPMPDTPGCSG